jgi:hypothetical protein
MAGPGHLFACAIVIASCAGTGAQEKAMKDDPLATAEAIVRTADAAWSKQDLEGMVGLFSPDATLESPLVQKLMQRPDGVCRGQGEIREVVRTLMQRGTPWASHAPPVVRGDTVFVEYKDAGNHPYSVDVLQLQNGKIQSLRAYLGWRPLSARAER